MLGELAKKDPVEAAKLAKLFDEQKDQNIAAAPNTAKRRKVVIEPDSIVCLFAPHATCELSLAPHSHVSCMSVSPIRTLRWQGFAPNMKQNSQR